MGVTISYRLYIVQGPPHTTRWLLYFSLASAVRAPITSLEPPGSEYTDQRVFSMLGWVSDLGLGLMTCPLLSLFWAGTTHSPDRETRKD